MNKELCINCNEVGSHFVPPSLGEEGFFICKKNKREKDLCVLCGKETKYYKDTHVDLRENYVDGAGQLCGNCSDNV